MKYIDADSIKDEIKHLKIDVYDESHQFDLGARCSLTFLESFIDSLQQEQPEVDLEKEIDNYLRPIAYEVVNKPFSTIRKCARHFYELGLNARKEGEQ